MKIKFRPIILALLGTGVGAGMLNVVKLISEMDGVVKIPAGCKDTEMSNSEYREIKRNQTAQRDRLDLKRLSNLGGSAPAG